MKIKKLILPVVVIILFCLIYFIGLPFYKSLTAHKNLYKNFENALTNLGITYDKKESSSEEYGAKDAYVYTANEKRIILYVFDKNSESYKKGVEEGFIISKENPESILYGFFTNNCALFMESGFPNDEQVLNLFSSLSKEYADTI